MSDDTPLDPINPESEPAPATEPTAAPTEPVAATPTGAAPQAWPTAPVQAAPRPADGSTIAVPKWLVLVLGALLVAVIGFGVGYAVAPGDDHHERAAFRPGSQFVPPTFDDGRGSDNLPTLPTPTPPQGRSAFLGVQASRSTDPAGARIERVVPESPAATAGLKADDVITKVDNESVTSQEQLATLIGDHKQGDTVTITYVRDGATKTANVTLKLRNAFEIPTPSTTRPQS
jgi:membrane-associated protease RseP (regulator of RpoE activity)